jgi:dipeptidyl aminopeptidase/acylaminoacyl peptidase
VRKYSEYPIEKLEIPWGNRTIPALLHLVPDRKKAPCILLICGMDTCKEIFPNPRAGLPAPNPFMKRGMHVLSIDGPGQGECYMRKIWVRPDNHKEAAKAAIDYLLTRPEVDGDKIGLYGISMGSYWAAHIAASDNRIKACATALGSFMINRHPIFEEASPRFRLTYKYMAGIEDDDDFDEMVAKMTVKGLGSKIRCPFLIQTGEFDAFFSEIAGPKEMWIMEDDFHSEAHRAFCHLPMTNMHADWLKDKLEGKYSRDLARRVLIPVNGVGPYS